MRFEMSLERGYGVRNLRYVGHEWSCGNLVQGIVRVPA
jgi:hypothetical protein